MTLEELRREAGKLGLVVSTKPKRTFPNPEVYKGKPLSYFIASLLREYNMTVAEATEFLGLSSPAYFHNKLHRNSFTLKDFTMLSEHFNVDIVICGEDKIVWKEKKNDQN